MTFTKDSNDLLGSEIEVPPFPVREEQCHLNEREVEIIRDKMKGVPDAEIGERYGISFTTLQQIITRAHGANVSLLCSPKKGIKRWSPSRFELERGSVWSFKQRGDWATHRGNYRGNWSPYIPRNVILRYSQPGDMVLDYFVGGGTTCIEAKLLGRRSIGIDINPAAVKMTVDNLTFSPPANLYTERDFPIFEPTVKVGDARDLSDISDNSIDLICAHPPYAGIIKYSTGIDGDLSGLPLERFLGEMAKVARESYRVLKPGGKCAILIGDARKEKRIVPVGFGVIQTFLQAGFSLYDLAIKRQHNCKTTGIWYKRSLHHNFLLIAHEYLPIFQKPITPTRSTTTPEFSLGLPYTIEMVDKVPYGSQEDVETTTVWLADNGYSDDALLHNLWVRFSGQNEGSLLRIKFSQAGEAKIPERLPIALIEWPQEVVDYRSYLSYRHTLLSILERLVPSISPAGVIAIIASDFREGDTLFCGGMMVEETLRSIERLGLKEMMILTKKGFNGESSSDFLINQHRYILIYQRVELRSTGPMSQNYNGQESRQLEKVRGTLTR